jgi:hypothetical protein
LSAATAKFTCCRDKVLGKYNSKQEVITESTELDLQPARRPSANGTVESKYTYKVLDDFESKKTEPGQEAPAPNDQVLILRRKILQKL